MPSVTIAAPDVERLLAFLAEVEATSERLRKAPDESRARYPHLPRELVAECSAKLWVDQRLTEVLQQALQPGAAALSRPQPRRNRSRE